MRRLLPLFGLLAAGFLTLVGLVRLMSNARREEPAAPPSPTSWHLTGWRQVGAEKLPWEIWGRTAPFFAYERLGSAVRLWRDQSGEIALPALSGKKAIVLRHLTSEGSRKPLTPFQRFQSFATDKSALSSGAPRHYLIRSPHLAQPTGELTAEYGVTVPTAVEGPLTLPGAILLDLAQTDQGPFPDVQLDLKHGYRSPEGYTRLWLSAAPIPNLDPAQLPVELRFRFDRNAAISQQENVVYGIFPLNLQSDPPSFELIRDPPLSEGQAQEPIRVRVHLELLLSQEARAYFPESVLAQGEQTLSLPLPSATRALTPPSRDTRWNTVDPWLLRRIRLLMNAHIDHKQHAPGTPWPFRARLLTLLEQGLQQSQTPVEWRKYYAGVYQDLSPLAAGPR